VKKVLPGFEPCQNSAGRLIYLQIFNRRSCTKTIKILAKEIIFMQNVSAISYAPLQSRILTLPSRTSVFIPLFITEFSTEFRYSTRYYDSDFVLIHRKDFNGISSIVENPFPFKELVISVEKIKYKVLEAIYSAINASDKIAVCSSFNSCQRYVKYNLARFHGGEKVSRREIFPVFSIELEINTSAIEMNPNPFFSRNFITNRIKKRKAVIKCIFPISDLTKRIYTPVTSIKSIHLCNLYFQLKSFRRLSNQLTCKSVLARCCFFLKKAKLLPIELYNVFNSYISVELSLLSTKKSMMVKLGNQDINSIFSILPEEIANYIMKLNHTVEIQKCKEEYKNMMGISGFWNKLTSHSY
jgi:hypothetical protein